MKESGLKPVRLADYWSKLPLVMGQSGIVWLSIGILASILLAGCEIIFITVLQAVFESFKILSSTTKSGVIDFFVTSFGDYILVILVLIAALRSAFSFLVGESANRSLQVINHKLRRVAVTHLLFPNCDKQLTTSQLNYYISEVFPKAALSSYYGSLVASSLTQSLIISLLLIYFDWQKALVAIFGFLIAGIIVTLANRKVRVLSREVPVQQRSLNRKIEMISRNLPLIKILRFEESERNMIFQRIDNYRNFAVSAACRANIISNSTFLFGISLIIVIIVTSKNQSSASNSTLISFLFLFLRMVQSLTVTSNAFGALNSNIPAFSEAVAYAESRKLLGTIINPQHSNRIKIGSIESKAAPRIHLNAVSFRYDSDSPYVIDRLNLNLLPGRILAITGPSGRGKSTLLHLILGLFKPESGQVCINGVSPQEAIESGQITIGYVGADSYVIEGTVRDNLLYGLDFSITDSMLQEVLSLCGLYDVKDKHTILEFKITESGEGLSSGQKQRLCLARALVRRPNLLVLDEASSNLDEATEAEIVSCVDRLRGACTVVIVTHKPLFKTIADELLEF